jgi:hypothetical protein
MNLILLKLLTQSNQHVGLLAFVKSYRNVLPYPESSHVLEESGRFAALAFFQFRMGHVQEAVTLLKELIDGSRVDSVDGDAVSLTSMVDLLQRSVHFFLSNASHEGLELLSVFLSHSVDQKQLVLETLPWLLKKDQLLALQVLKDLTLEENADINIHLLEPYPTLRLVFLEYLIFQRNSQVYLFFYKSRVYCSNFGWNIVCSKKLCTRNWPAHICTILLTYHNLTFIQKVMAGKSEQNFRLYCDLLD